MSESSHGDGLSCRLPQAPLIEVSLCERILTQRVLFSWLAPLPRPAAKAIVDGLLIGDFVRAEE